ncbi:TetR/AcrR family transcriptional regulator [Streptomyces beihaiensis]|uniref:TetR family transcriptional regulator n=1 Tax=Streptomyces beihaiensis TaxID=2984495 RepID=A0ABT3TQ63_9ACTN|nr:TetR family transcriptional regulator [Streptomyces beihaiensis]MCX3059180.1 TetR family transcriptional regulator [Streptomyces beihaiensis]
MAGWGAMMSSPDRNRRADALRSRAAILDAAIQVLDATPDAGLSAVAAAAGVTRPTVYAHFPSRERLLQAVTERLTEESVAAMDAVDLDTGPAAEALIRMLDAGSRVTARHPGLVRLIAAQPVAAEADHARHSPVADRIRRAVLRGRQAGEFDDRLPVDWVVSATIALGHAASEERETGRLTAPAAQDSLRASLLRLLGADSAAE